MVGNDRVNALLQPTRLITGSSTSVCPTGISRNGSTSDLNLVLFYYDKWGDKLLKLESKLEVQRTMDETRRLKGLKPQKAPEGIYFALRENQLPVIPRSPLGVVLFTIIAQTWALEVTPDAWDSVDIISLFKSKDPELMTNYRGISLISVGLKIVLMILQARIVKGLEDR